MQQIKDQDAELIKLVQAGNKRVFNKIILKYQYKIFNLLKIYIRDRNDCLDLVQEVFLKAYLAIPKFKHKSSFYTWLYKIAINTAKTHIVESSRDNWLILYNCQNSNLDSHYISKNLQLVHDTLEQNIIFNELENIFCLALKKLPLELKNTIILRELNGLSYEQIAQISSCPLGTVRSRVFRAKEAIEEQIKTYQKSCKENKYN